MNILQLTVDYPPPLTGGLPHQVQGLSHALASRHSVGIVASGPNRHDGPIRVFGADTLPDALPSFHLPYLARVNVGLVKGLVEARAARSWDIIHAHDWMVAPAAVFAHELLGIPVVASIHTDAGSRTVVSMEDRSRRLDWESSLAGVASLLLGVSTPIRDLLAERYPAVASGYLPNGINPAGFMNAGDARVANRILFAGRLVPYKGCQDAIRAVALLRRDWPDIEMGIVGDGFYRPELESLVTELDLSASVTFHGWTEGEDLVEAYGQAGVVVVPSHEEAFGIVAIEAMAAGAPVIASSIPAFASYIEHERTGLLSAAGDAEDLARQVGRLLRNPELRREMARNALQDVVPKHAWDRVIAAAETAYRDVLRG
jgi:glycosyltransferase involved in cell wall biosynthesis